MSSNMDYTINTEDPLLIKNELLPLWDRCLGKDFPLDMRLYTQQLSMDRDVHIFFTARDIPSNMLIGAILAKRAVRSNPNGEIPRKSSISFIMVDPEFQRKGIGVKLLKRAETWCRQQNAATIALGSDYYHFFPGPPTTATIESNPAIAFFEAFGYSKGSIENDVIADLHNLTIPLPPESRITKAPGFYIACSSPELRPRIFDFFNRTFSGRWNNEIHEAFSAGMRDEDLVLVIHESDNRVVGFSRIYTEESPILGPGLYWRKLLGPNPGALGPIGIDAEYRGLGLGMDILRGALAELKARNVRNTVIDWTDLGSFYAKFGFVPWKQYVMMQKEIAQTSKNNA